MNDIKKVLKYFFLGFLFHIFVFAASYATGYGYYEIHYFSLFIFALDVAVVLAVGLLRGGTYGAAFAASSFLVGVISMPILYSRWYYFYERWSGSAVETFVLVAYGYIPANYYRRERTGKSLVIGFFIALFLNLVLHFPYVMYFAAIPLLFNLVLGGLSSLLCFRHLRPILSTSQSISHLPKQSSSLSPSSRSSMIRCPNCGHSNPSNFNYCGKCGGSLQEKEETQIY